MSALSRKRTWSACLQSLAALLGPGPLVHAPVSPHKASLQSIPVIPVPWVTGSSQPTASVT